MIKPINTAPSAVLNTKAIKCFPNEPAPLTGELYPDKDSSMWSAEIVQLVTDLKDTAISLGDNCAGLAANQIWDKPTPPPAIFVVKFNTENERGEKNIHWVEFINPEITTSGNTIKTTESCFSRPGLSVKKNRKSNVTIKFQNLFSKDWYTQKIFLKQSYIPIVLQHEYDHLQGKLI